MGPLSKQPCGHGKHRRRRLDCAISTDDGNGDGGGPEAKVKHHCLIKYTHVVGWG